MNGRSCCRFIPVSADREFGILPPAAESTSLLAPGESTDAYSTPSEAPVEAPRKGTLSVVAFTSAGNPRSDPTCADDEPDSGNSPSRPESVKSNRLDGNKLDVGSLSAKLFSSFGLPSAERSPRRAPSACGVSARRFPCANSKVKRK